MEIEEQFEIFGIFVQPVEISALTLYYFKNNDDITQPLKVEDICKNMTFIFRDSVMSINDVCRRHDKISKTIIL